MTTTTTVDQGRNNDGESFLADHMILETVQWINRCHFSVVGLQFPDELLPISVPIFRSLQWHLSSNQTELYIMADTTYGSCCVDQVAAQHINAHAVVHYGPACLSTPASLPVFYVLPRLPLSDHLINIIAQTIFSSLKSSDSPIFENQPDGPVGEKILLMYDVGYHWKSETIADRLKTQYNLPIVRHELELVESTIFPILSQPQRSTNCPPIISSCNDQQVCGQSSCQEKFKPCSNNQSVNPQITIHQLDLKEEDRPIDLTEDNPRSSTVNSTIKKKNDYSDYKLVIYIGVESPRLTHFLVTHPSLPMIVIDPNRIEEQVTDHQPIQSSSETQSNRAKKLLMRRYATIQKARDADVFGIIVGTLGVKNYLELIRKTKELIEKEYKKKTYIISVGKLKPEKLMNFAEIETWVLIDCPESSMLVLDGKTGQRYDPKQFGAPIITPWELEIALASCNNQSKSEGTDHSRGVWDGRLVLDFDRILSVWQPDPIQNLNNHISNNDDQPNSNPACPSPPTNETKEEFDADAPVFSLVTGGYKYRKNWNEENPEVESKSKQLIPHNLSNSQELIQSIKGAASEYALSKRTYRGLDARLGLDPPSEIEIGRAGIPKAYQDDHHPHP